MNRSSRKREHIKFLPIVHSDLCTRFTFILCDCSGFDSLKWYKFCVYGCHMALLFTPCFCFFSCDAHRINICLGGMVLSCGFFFFLLFQHCSMQMHLCVHANIQFTVKKTTIPQTKDDCRQTPFVKEKLLLKRILHTARFKRTKKKLK